MCTYGIELWECVRKSIVATVHTVSHLWITADTLWYVSNPMLQRDLRVSYVHDIIHHSSRHHAMLGIHGINAVTGRNKVRKTIANPNTWRNHQPLKAMPFPFSAVLFISWQLRHSTTYIIFFSLLTHNYPSDSAL